MKRVIDVIKIQKHSRLSDSDGFNMSDYTHFCGTPSCIAGLAADMSGLYVHEYDEFIAALTFMKLSIDQAIELFTYPSRPANGGLYFITPEQAVTAIQNLIDGCEVKDIWAHLLNKGE